MLVREMKCSEINKGLPLGSPLFVSLVFMLYASWRYQTIHSNLYTGEGHRANYRVATGVLGVSFMPPLYLNVSIGG